MKMNTVMRIKGITIQKREVRTIYDQRIIFEATSKGDHGYATWIVNTQSWVNTQHADCFNQDVLKEIETLVKERVYA